MNMPNILPTAQIRTVSDRLFAEATHDDGTPRWRRSGKRHVELIVGHVVVSGVREGKHFS
jgi:hypothetical protein